MSKVHDNVNVVDEKLKWNGTFESLFIIAEVVVIIIYALTANYEDRHGFHGDVSEEAEDVARQHMQTFYPMWQDVHVMIYIGFGFLMVFLKSFSWSAVGFNYLLSAWAFQWAILVLGFWYSVFGDFDRIHLDVNTLVAGDFAAASCMIMFGAVLGKADLVQMFWLVTFQVIFYGLNEAICLEVLHATDIGGSMTIHTFGAYFGLAASYFFKRHEAIEDKEKKNGGNYTSNLVAMFGTIFLYLYWPSFNAALAPIADQQRAAVNTALSISGSLIAAACWSRLVHHKLDMEIMLNATLAGGVMIGASADFIMGGGGAMVIGCLAGLISAFGFTHLHGWLKKWIGLSDVCGVHNLHGMPGFFGGIISGVCATFADRYLEPGTAIETIYPLVAKGERDFKTQGSYQIAALAVTLGISIGGGIISGFIASRFGNSVESVFDDKEHWHNCVEDAPEHESVAHAEPVKGSYWDTAEKNNTVQ